MSIGCKSVPEPLTNVDPRLRHGFHPVALSSEIGETLTSVRLLGEPWVLSRTPSGLIGFVDRCPHRGAPLSLGDLENGIRLRCAYHGWCFDREGHGVHIPALGDGAKTPPRAVLRPPAALEEHYGIVWLAPEPPLAPVIEIPESQDDRFSSGIVPPCRAAVGAGLMIDNFLDMAHFPFVHRGTFGADSPEEIRDYSTTPLSGGFSVSYDDTFTNREDPGVAAGIRPLVQQWRMTYNYRIPFSVRLRLDFLDAGGANVVAFFVQPETNEMCRLYTNLYRDDTGGDESLMAEAVKYQEQVMAEDLVIQERYLDNSLPLDPTAEIHTRADRITLELRRSLLRMMNATP